MSNINRNVIGYKSRLHSYITIYYTGTVCEDCIILYDADDIQFNNSNNNFYYKQ